MICKRGWGRRQQRNEEIAMSNLLRRYAGSLRRSLDSLLAPAVDPRQAFAGAYERQRELLGLAQRALLDLAATRSQLDARARAIEAQLPQHQQQARRALQAGETDLARLALRRRLVAAAELRTLVQHVHELQHKQQTLALHEQRLATQLEAFEARVKLIAASYSAAEAQVRIGEAFDGVSTEMSDLSHALTLVEQQAMHLQTRAAGMEDTIEDALIDAEIAALRQQLGV
jgi:phage shock protein A